MGQPVGADTTDRATGWNRLRPAILIAGFSALLAAAVAVPFVVLGGGGDESPTSREGISTELASTAAARRGEDPELAARLSLAAYRIAPTPAAQAAMVASFAWESAVQAPGEGVAHPAVAVSPSGTLAAGTGDDGILRIWELTPGGEPTLTAKPVFGDDPSSGVAFGGNGDLLATGGTANAGRLWRVTAPAAPELLTSLPAQARTVRWVAVAADGTLLVTVGEDGTAGLWDVSDPADPRELGLQRVGVLTDMALNPTGEILAIVGVGGSVQLWGLGDREHPARLGTAPGHVGAVNAVAFSADGTMMVTGGDDRTVRTWDVTDPAAPRPVHELTGHTTSVTAVAFLASGQAVSADADGLVAYWDLTGAAERVTDESADRSSAGPTMVDVAGLGSKVEAIAADADVQTVVVSTEDGQVIVWTADAGRLADVACADPSTVRMDEAEWKRLVPGLPYRDTCPA